MDERDKRDGVGWDDSRLGLGSCQKQDLRDFMIGQDWEARPISRC